MKQKLQRGDRFRVIETCPERGNFVAERASSDGEVHRLGGMPLREGVSAPPGSQIIYCHKVEPGLHEVDDVVDVPGRAPALLDGPAQVATPAYREGYDRVFGKRDAYELN